MVSARHLVHFNRITPTICYPKPSKSELCARLLVQCRDLGVNVISEIPSLEDYDIIMDSIFVSTCYPPLLLSLVSSIFLASSFLH